MSYWNSAKPDEMWMKGTGIFSGKTDWKKMPEDHPLLKMSIVKAFVEDDDLVEMTVTSACIGFVYTFQKRESK